MEVIRHLETDGGTFEEGYLELHVYNPQHELIDYLKSKNIVPEAYSPLGSTNSPLLTDETVLKIAQKYSLSAADVLIGYLVSKGFIVIPKSVTPSRIASNLNGPVIAMNKLSATDIAALDGLAAAGKQKRFVIVQMFDSAHVEVKFPSKLRFVTPPWRKCKIYIETGTSLRYPIISALDLGFDNWPPYKK
ncbi:hypothetical protein C0992_008270 [Termitomyces sp. T32_za158]|nr:hypothetical protein C0992_008270 [Termitomyces sp. T32_za158]